MLKKLFFIIAVSTALSSYAAVDVNKATEADLDSIKGVGPATSKQIMAERKKAEFKDWDDLMSRVKGIGSAKAARFSTQGLTVNGTAFKGEATPSVTAPIKKTGNKGD